MDRVQTKDTWLAAYLLCKGGELENIVVIPGTKTAVCSIKGNDDLDLSEIRECFFQDDTVPAMTYKNAVNNLKQEIFEKLGRSTNERKKFQ